MTVPGVSRNEVLARELERIRSLIARNIPRNGNPDRFHEDKSEATNDLTKVIRALRGGELPTAG